MGRNELFITVPNLFRCPISLDVMKSPVSLCTGVTYDRSSIQHWLDTGHDTCPATMQVLSTKDFVPNLTLHRLINLWNQSSTRRLDSDNSPVAPTISEQQVGTWIEEIQSLRVESLMKIVEYLNYSEENRKFLARFGCFVDAIGSLLKREGVEIRVLELVIRILDLISVQNGVKEKMHSLLLQSHGNCLSSFLSVIRDGNSNAKIESIRVLGSITIDNKSKQFIAETENFVPALIDLLKSEKEQDQQPSKNDAVLSFLISIAINRSIKTQVVQLGLVQIVSNLLADKNAAVSVTEKCLKLLTTMSTCKEGRAAISEDPKCAGCIVERLMKVSKAATENGVLVLWSMCCSLRDERMQEKVMRSNGLTKLLLVMQSEGDGTVRRMCGELMKVLRVGYRYGGGMIMSYETKTTHIMPC